MKKSRKTTVQGLFKGGSIIFLGLIIELFVSFVAKILMARVLGQVEYGIATLGITILTFSSAILLLGLNNGVGRYLPRFDEASRRKGVIQSALRVSLPLSALVALVLWVFAGPIATTLLRTPEAIDVIRIAAIGLPFAVMLKLSIGVVQGMEQSLPKVVIRNLFQPITRFLLIGAALLLSLGSLGVMWAYTLTFALSGIAGMYYIFTRTPILEKIQGRRMHRELVLFSAPLMLMTSMMMILSNLDIFFLSFFQSAGDIGVYNVVYPLAELLTMTLSGFSFIFMPMFSRLESGGEFSDMERLYQVVTKWILLLTIPGLLLLGIFPEISIGVTFGWEYTDGSLALSILAVGFFSHAVMGPNMNALTAIGRTKVIMYCNILAAILNVVLNIALIPNYSFLGAAVATAVSYLLLNALYSFALYRETGIHPFTPLIFRPGGAALGLVILTAGLSILIVPTSVIGVVGTFLVFLLLYIPVVIRFGAVQEEEIMLLLSIEERFGVDLSFIKRFTHRLID